MTSSFSFKKIIIALVGILAFFSVHSLTYAQTATPQVIITWQAHGSYTPPGYQDKALSNWSSPITASLMLLYKGAAINLQNQTIYWYTDDTLIGGGQGTSAISFIPAGGAPDLITLKVELPNYPGGFLIHTVQIPVVQPKVVIEANHPTAAFNNNSLALQSTPYFFNISDPSALSYSWSVNGTAPEAALDPQTLDLTVNQSTPNGSAFAAALSVTDPIQKITAQDAVTLTYQKQP